MEPPIGLWALLAELRDGYPQAEMAEVGSSSYVYIEKDPRAIEVRRLGRRWYLELWHEEEYPILERMCTTRPEVVRAVRDWLQ